MKKFLYSLIMIAALLSSCNDYETYGDKKEKERNAISKFIADSSFTIISEEQFVKNGYKTDLTRKEFVKLDKSGVYMQIVRDGCGEKIKDGESMTLDCRFCEYDILNDTTVCYNDRGSLASSPDRLYVSCSGSTYNANFLSGIMQYVYTNVFYTTASVPSGWLVPLTYVKVGRPQANGEQCAKVRLIIPHTQGHAYASQNVAPYFYTLTLQREL